MTEDEQAILHNAIREAIITKEDKQDICDALLLALKKTRHLHDLVDGQKADIATLYNHVQPCTTM